MKSPFKYEVTFQNNIETKLNIVISSKKKEDYDMAEWFTDVVDLWYEYFFGM